VDLVLVKILIPVVEGSIDGLLVAFLGSVLSVVVCVLIVRIDQFVQFVINFVLFRGIFSTDFFKYFVL